MKENATHDLFMKHLYHETGVTEDQAINDALEANPELREELEQYEDVKKLLDTANRKPHRRVLRDIMAYSRKTRRIELHC